MTDKKRNLFASGLGDTAEAAIRQAKIKYLHAKFMRTYDMETLAELVQLDPPCGDKAVGHAISTVLRNKRPDKKAYNDTLWRDVDKMFHYFNQKGHTITDSYAKVAEIFFPTSDQNEAKSLEDIKKQHNRWLKKSGQNF